jgi:hypothetical protein
MNQTKDPMAAELEQIEARLDAQNRVLQELCSLTSALGEVELAVAYADLEAIAEACAVRVTSPKPAATGIRC